MRSRHGQSPRRKSMPSIEDTIKASEPQTNIIPIRAAYFSSEFWRMWDQLMDRQKAAYILGWIAELELVIRRMSKQVRTIEDHMEDDGK
jgi:hypothetical protein